MATSFTLPSAYAGTRPESVSAPFLPQASTLLARLRALLPRRRNEVEAFIAANGGTLTDDLERDISRRFGSAAGI